MQPGINLPIILSLAIGITAGVYCIYRLMLAKKVKYISIWIGGLFALSATIMIIWGWDIYNYVSYFGRTGELTGSIMINIGAAFIAAAIGAVLFIKR